MNRRAIVATGLLAGALAALPACRTAPVPRADPEAFRLGSSARAALDRGALDIAVRLYRRALMRARAMDDAGEIGVHAYNLAACLAEQGAFGEALAHLQESERELARAGRGTIDARLLRAEIERQRGNPDAAGEIAAALLHLPAAERPSAATAQALLIQGRAACAKADVQPARRDLEQAREEIRKQPGNDFLRAAETSLAAELALLAKDSDAAGREFDRAAKRLRDAGRFAAMARAQGQAGQAYLDAGKPKTASERFYRAARSLFSQGMPADALAMLQSAVRAAEKAGDEGALRRAGELLEEVKGSVEKLPSP